MLSLADWLLMQGTNGGPICRVRRCCFIGRKYYISIKLDSILPRHVRLTEVGKHFAAEDFAFHNPLVSRIWLDWGHLSMVMADWRGPESIHVPQIMRLFLERSDEMRAIRGSTHQARRNK